MKISILLISSLIMLSISAQELSEKNQDNVQEEVDTRGIDKLIELDKSDSEETNDQNQLNNDDEFDLEAFLSDMLLDQAEGGEEFVMPELYGYLDEGTEEAGEEEQILDWSYLDKVDEIPEIITEWPEIMHNFSPDDMIAFELESGAYEVLFQNIELPTTIRGAFFIPFYPESNQITFEIQNHDHVVFHKVYDVQDDIFEVEIKVPGEYLFMFHNKRSDNKYLVNFALDAHSSRAGHLKQHDIDPFSLRLENIHNAMRDNFFETKFTQARQESGYNFLASTHNKLLLFTIIETVGIITINLWQIFYIKRILENKRLI